MSRFKKMYMTCWTREIIRSKLQEWQADKLSSSQICEWAQSEWWPLQDDYDDIEKKDSSWESVCRDVLWMLEDMKAYCLFKEDIPALLSYLDTQVGGYFDGKNKFDAYMTKSKWSVK
ncbi:hypothetical protein [Hymenobacter cavernae]|uniref:Uncharacterized protein n=1 Tax=Hymenobacter cavernae TaxID=2044852 RepID=A0ABQ1UNQ1_9BACT|nr:hypothetical protein [Hymenobacter cavernae]GGF21438.1 hypothetical protein GCM10011383_36360 [Hymenobacter cavernae]